MAEAPGDAEEVAAVEELCTTGRTDAPEYDIAASARTGEPYVRQQVPERALTTWLAVDVSPSMAFGTADRLKSDVAEGVARVIARTGLRRAGKVGLLTFGAAEPVLLAPRGGRRAMVALRSSLDAGVAPDGHADPEAMTRALRRLARLAVDRDPHANLAQPGKHLDAFAGSGECGRFGQLQG